VLASLSAFAGTALGKICIGASVAAASVGGATAVGVDTPISPLFDDDAAVVTENTEPDIAGYNIWYSFEPGATKELLTDIYFGPATRPPDRIYITDFPRSLTSGKDCYQVSAVDSGGLEGPRSAEACFDSTPGPPSQVMNVTVGLGGGSGEVEVSWDPVPPSLPRVRTFCTSGTALVSCATTSSEPTGLQSLEWTSSPKSPRRRPCWLPSRPDCRCWSRIASSA